VIVAVLAGGRSRRMGTPKALALLGGEPLIMRPLAAAREAGFPAIVVAKRSSPLPELDVPVIYEPDEISHPLAGLIAALEHAPGIVAVACDQPWVTGEAIRLLAARPEPIASPPGQPFPGRYDERVLPRLREALARQAPLREVLAGAATIELPDGIAASVNTPEDLAAAEARL
jgi:molybdenum cofactor guanylyltransferase